MKRPFWIALLAAVAFVAIVLARMPAAWVIPARGAQWACASIDGSLWSGTCAGLTVSGTPLGELSWELHPLRLVLGRLAAHLTVSHGPADAAADARRLMEKRLAGARGAGGGLLPALQALVQARDAAPGTSVQSLNFHSGDLEMKLSAPDASSLDRLSQSLRSNGWQADLTGGTNSGSAYEGRIQMHSRGS